MMCASGGGCHCWAFCDDLVKLKLARGGERFSWRRIRVCLHERLALSPLIEILFRSPVSHDDIVIALHRPQDFGFDESWRLCNVPFSFLPSLLEILFPPLRDRYSVRDDQDHGDPWRSVCILAIRARLLSISLSQQRTAERPETEGNENGPGQRRPAERLKRRRSDKNLHDSRYIDQRIWKIWVGHPLRLLGPPPGPVCSRL